MGELSRDLEFGTTESPRSTMTNSYAEIAKLEEHPQSEDLLILFGSQTGTAEEVAMRLARDSMRLGLTPCVKPFSCNAIREISTWIGPSRVVVCVASTAGQGDPPDTMKHFWKEICRAKWNTDFFKGLNYGVIALGDSSYEKYNFMGKKLHRRLQLLGGTPVLELCLGDDQHDLGYHAAVNPWISQLWTVICQRIGISQNKLRDIDFTKFSMQYGHSESDENLTKTKPVYQGGSMSMELRKIIGNQRLTSPSHFQDTRLISIDLNGSRLTFEPGDVLTVQPRNLPENVDKFFEIFPRLIPDSQFFLYYNPKVHWGNLPQEILYILGPQPWSWRNVVIHLLDIQSVPRSYFFEMMSKFASNPLEKERLSEFCTPEGQDDLLNYCYRPKRNILEVLQDFHNTANEVPQEAIFDIFPVIKPRSFSIASSRALYPDKLQILVAVVEYQTKIVEKRKGLCSNWLAHHCPGGTRIPVWIQKGSFTFPLPEEDASVIMIGPGTGVAPFRSVISNNPDSWNKLLFFGCRNEFADFYFKNEWNAMVEHESLKLFCAFSRDASGNKRDYVQDVILKEAEELKKVFTSNKKFYIFVAGNAKQMPKDVRAAIAEVMELSGIEDSMSFIDICAKRLGTYQTETWS